MTEPTDANAELMKAAVKRSRDQYKLDTSRAAFQAGAIFGAAFRTPQPNQAQTGAVPLTDEMQRQMKERCDSYEMRGAFADGWLSAEAAHGIKGGKHGAE